MYKELERHVVEQPSSEEALPRFNSRCVVIPVLVLRLQVYTHLFFIFMLISEEEREKLQEVEHTNRHVGAGGRAS